MTTADTNFNLIAPMTPSARDVITASTVHVGEPELAQDPTKLLRGSQSRLGIVYDGLGSAWQMDMANFGANGFPTTNTCRRAEYQRGVIVAFDGLMST